MPEIFPECNSLIPIQHLYEMLGESSERSNVMSLPLTMRTNESSEVPSLVDVIIVGGGMIGCGVACQLRKTDPSLKICIIDPLNSLLENYRNRVNTIGQKVMRSPYDHQFAPDGDMQLLDFAKVFYNELSKVERQQVRNASGGQRSLVPLDLFMGHASHVINNYGLMDLSFKCKASKIEHTGHDYKVTLSNGGVVRASSVILSIGLKSKASFFGHKYNDLIISCYHNNLKKVNQGNVCVVGSGLSAAHVISTLSKKLISLTWIIRKDEEIYKCTDINSLYFREEGIRNFQKRNLHDRIGILSSENRGSFMLEFKEFMEAYETSGQLKVIRGKAVQNILVSDQSVTVICDENKLQFDKIIDCTGLELDHSLFPPDTKFYSKYPILNDDSLSLVEYPKFFVVGALAALSLGPGSKNVEGIRLASQKIIRTLGIGKQRKNENLSLIIGQKAIS